MAYHFQIIEDCLKCAFREQNLFCDLPREALYSAAAILKRPPFIPRGHCCAWKASLPEAFLCYAPAAPSSPLHPVKAKSMILRVAEPGEVLGLTAAVANSPYEATVETLEPSQANFIAQADFVRFLQEFPDVGLKVAKQLTHNCKCAYDEIRSLGLSNSVPEKLAKLILRWAEHPLELSSKKPNETALRVTLTQEEIAQFIGTSRETVSRVLTGFRRKGFIRVKGATWTITNRRALENLVTT